MNTQVKVLILGLLIMGLITSVGITSYNIGLEESKERTVDLKRKLVEAQTLVEEMGEAWQQLKEDHIRLSDELDKRN